MCGRWERIGARGPGWCTSTGRRGRNARGGPGYGTARHVHALERGSQNYFFLPFLSFFLSFFDFFATVTLLASPQGRKHRLSGTSHTGTFHVSHGVAAQRLPPVQASEDWPSEQQTQGELRVALATADHERWCSPDVPQDRAQPASFTVRRDSAPPRFSATTGLG